MSRKIALDLSKFKHVKSDDKSTTLQHKDGHTLTIAHGKLTKDFQKQLSALSAMAGKGPDQQPAYASGGSVKKPDPSNIDDWTSRPLDTAAQGFQNVKNNLAAPSPTPSSIPKSPGHDSMNYASGGEVYGGTQAVSGPAPVATSSISANPIQLQQSKKEAPKTAPQSQTAGGAADTTAGGSDSPVTMAAACGGQVPQKFADGGDVQGLPTDLPEKQPMMTPNPDIQQAGAQAQQNLNALPSKNPQDTNLQAQKDMYNMMVAQGGGTREDMFGENGEPPKNPVNPDTWNNVKNSPDTQKLGAFQMMQTGRDWKNQQQLQEHQHALAQNQVNNELGIPNQPDPGAPQPAAPEAQPPVGDKLVQPPIQPPADPMDPMSMLQSGYNDQIAGIKGQANAQVQKAQQDAEIYKQQQVIQQQAQDHYQQSYQALDKERQGLIQDIKNGFVDPDQYWKGVKDPETGEMHGGHSKIMAGIGILLGGFNNRGDGKNVALDNIHYQMDKNIEAQSKNLQAKDNLLGHNIRQFGNLKDGVMMTRIMQNDMLVDKLQEAAAKSASPQAIAAAQQAIGQVKAQNAPLFRQFAMQRAMMNMANNGTTQPGALEHMVGMLRVMNPEMAKEMETRMVPGIGPNGSAALASVPVPTEIRDKLTAFQNTSNLINDLQTFVKHNSTILPGTAAYNVGAQKALMLQSAIREGQLGTVYKAGEQPLLDKFVSSNPAGAMKMLQTVPQLKALLETNSMQMNNLKKSYGLPVSQMAPQNPAAQQQAALQWAKANPHDPRAAKILQLVGK